MQGAPETVTSPSLHGVAVQHAEHGLPQGSEAPPEIRGKPLALPRQGSLPPQLPLHLHHTNSYHYSLQIDHDRSLTTSQARVHACSAQRRPFHPPGRSRVAVLRELVEIVSRVSSDGHTHALPSEAAG